MRRSDRLRNPPLFIIGPARSGTTLIYQSVVTAFAVAYLSNAAIRCRKYPALVTALTTWFGGMTPPSRYVSEHGRTKGWRAPAQGYEVWSRWFRIEGDTTLDFRWTETDLADVRGMVCSIERSAGAPFVNKWNGHNAHLRLLSEAFPTALFVRIRRDPVANAISVYRARVKMRGDPSANITRVSPSYRPFANADPITQVCAYTLSMEQDLDADSDRLGRERFLEIGYEGFCAAPEPAMKELGQWYGRHSACALKRRGSLPERFEASLAVDPTNELTAAIRIRMDELNRAEFAKPAGPTV